MFKGVGEVMYFVTDRARAANWYARLVDVPVTYVAEADHYFIRIGAHEMGFHDADRKLPSGPAGQVAYWEVDDFDAALAKAQRMGAELYRGPLRRPSGLVQCQLKDPFGNVLGLLGPSRPSTLIAPGLPAEATPIAPPVAPLDVALRGALLSDIDEMVALSARKRAAYAQEAPTFWRTAGNADPAQARHFERLLGHDDVVALVAEVDGVVAGFLMAKVITAPPVYDPGTRVCQIDDFCVATVGLWRTVGAALLDEARRLGALRGAGFTVVVCGQHDRAKADVLAGSGLNVVSEWWVG